jgi:2-succinyl-5-enolpyruvyl-6-hydroxy-3-cyclohexene-1-carboxylate synthase
MRAVPSRLFATTFVDELTRCGIRHACLAPGSRSAAVALAFAEHEGISLHVTLDERSAAFLALGIAKATSAPVPVLSTSGTAAANFTPAVHEANMAGVPLIVLTADRPPELRDTGANQTIDQVKLYGDAVRWFSEVGLPEAQINQGTPYWRSLACRAVAEALGSPPGPVHLNVPFREPLVPVQGEGTYLDTSGARGKRPWTEVRHAPRNLPEHEIAALADELQSVERGLLIAGAGCTDADAVVRLAGALGWPLLADPLSNSRRGPCAVAAYDHLLRVRSFVDHNFPVDLIVRIGSLGISKALSSLTVSSEEILIDPYGAWRNPTLSLTRVIVADTAPLLDALAERVQHREPSSWLRTWTDADTVARKALEEVFEASEEISEPRLARELVTALPDGSNLLVAASMPFRDVEWYSMPREGVHFYGNRGANGIDGHVSTALGIALGSGAPTFTLSGDLSLLHDQNGLLAEDKDAVALTFAVANNDGGGIFSFLPQAKDRRHFERLYGTPHHRDLAKVASLHGCEHVLLEKATDLPAALTRIRLGVRIIEARTDRARNVEIHNDLQEAVRRAL